MKSRIARAIGLEFSPVAVSWTDKMPQDAKQFKKGRFGCVMFMLAAAARGKTAVFDRETYGCYGGGVGLGFGNTYKAFPGGEEGFCRFLSTGNKGSAQGEQIAEQLKPFVRQEFYDDFMLGERYLKSPQLVEKFIQNLPITDVPQKYAVFQPLSAVDEKENPPDIVAFLADMDQLAALVIFANHSRQTNDNVTIPWAAGCQTLALYPLQESRSKNPRAVVGLTDISARLYVKRALKRDLMSFAAPFALFKEMEENLDNSFVERTTWKELVALKKG
ncbi:MAG: DUF169 domain-containing protein [Desulfatibacillaceae bacterium]|nr:DUF169 domain-containing protein [Desulfatibacillaceae bacterium]